MTPHNQSRDYDRLDFTNVERIRQLRDTIFVANNEMEALANSIPYDVDLLMEVYQIYKAQIGDRDFKKAETYNRKKYLMAVMYLFSPATLAGGKMKSGLRQKLAVVMGVENHTTISANLQDVMILYRNYRDFRRDVNSIVKTFFEKIYKTIV